MDANHIILATVLAIAAALLLFYIADRVVAWHTRRRKQRALRYLPRAPRYATPTRKQ